MNVLEKYNNDVFNNDAEIYLRNFKQRLSEHMQHNDMRACNETLVEIHTLQNTIHTEQTVASGYFLDILLQMEQLTHIVMQCIKNKGNNLLNENVASVLNTQLFIDTNLMNRIIKYKLVPIDIIEELQYKLKNAIDNSSSNNSSNSSIYLNECDQLFGKNYDNRYNQLYETIIKNKYIYDSEQKYNHMSKTKKKNTNCTTISVNQIKSMIDTVINETLTNEINLIVPDPRDPEDSIDDFAGDYLNDLNDTVKTLIANVENETDDWENSYDRLVDIYKKLTAAIDNPRLSSRERKQLESEYDGILGNIHRVIGGGGGGTEKFYVAETTSKPINDRQRMLIIKWCETMGCRKAAIRMIDSILNTSIGLSSADLADTTTFANGVDSIEDALEAKDYQGAYEIAKDTASEMVAEEGGDDLMEGKCGCGKTEEKCDCQQLSECGSWNEAINHPQFKEAIVKEVAPPGMESWIKSNKERFKKQYGAKKGTSALYATAWKMFYKKK